MKIPQDIIKREPQQVQDLFTFWCDIMDRKVDFWPLMASSTYTLKATVNVYCS